ncbi:DUF2637 domain-containing protein [Acrocarpospora catenulata]|uniref:DUF2637 domain-containing protein n=1 Tax=Acrocarpospora catenulata TaxID=2836182 RepID=UPI001BDA7108|nr:DUF2637 domain-containing protein [Acrocarpospora catenulata]
MDATPPAAAGPAARSFTRPAPGPAGIPLLLRRLAIGLAGLALAILAGAACVLSFEDLRVLAMQSGVEPRLAYLYPAGFDALLVVTLITVPLLRTGRLLVRFQVGAMLAVLLAGAAAATVATATAATFDPRQAAIVVALLPWVMLLLGLWLLLVLVKHTRARRADLDDDAEDEELVPFDHQQPKPVSVRQTPPEVRQTPPEPEISEPKAPELKVSEPHVSAEAAAPPDYVPPVPVSPVAETVAPPELAPPLEPEPPKRPARWGDLIRPNVGDVLVHPRPTDRDGDEEPETPPDDPAFADAANEEPAEQERRDQQDASYWAGEAEQQAADETPAAKAEEAKDPEAKSEESDIDTQPLRKLRESPDPGHGLDAADPEERLQPYDPEPPLGRMRSTPIPPG